MSKQRQNQHEAAKDAAIRQMSDAKEIQTTTEEGQRRNKKIR